MRSPYQRLMLELYADAPFALVGVNSDADLKEAKQNKAENFGADSGYRSWWDGHAAVNTAGPIAQRWGVTGWPTICKMSDLPCAVAALLTPNALPDVLDHMGTMRFAGLRHEDSLKAVAHLMTEMRELGPVD